MDAPPPLRRAVPRAAAALLLPCLIGIGARMAGGDIVVFAVVTVVASVFGIMVALRGLGLQRTWPVVGGIILYATVPFIVVAVLTEARAIGPIQEVPSDQAGRHPFAAGFLFTDGATPRADMQEVVTVVDSWTMRRGGESRRQDTYVVAPVLPPGWRPGEPVAVVAIAASRSELSRRIPDHDAWSAPGGLLRRLDEDLQTRAVYRALQRRGLVASDNLVIGTWEPSPGWARLESMVPALILIGGALAVLLALTAYDRLVAPPKAARRR